jgi:2-phosphosulfolactate phosphatase
VAPHRLGRHEPGCCDHAAHHGGAPSGDAPDGATIAHGLYTKFARSLKKTIRATNHAVRLKELGSEADIPYCSEIDLFNHVPRLQDGILR